MVVVVVCDYDGRSISLPRAQRAPLSSLEEGGYTVNSRKLRPPQEFGSL